MNSQNHSPLWIRELSYTKFLAVYDVALDIREEMQLNSEPCVAFSALPVKFSALLPVDETDVREHYFGVRQQAITFLHERRAIEALQDIDGERELDGHWRVKLDKPAFLALAESMDAEYARRNSADDAGSRHPLLSIAQEKALDAVLSLLSRFHSVVLQLQIRHHQRPTLEIHDEYDVQDLLHSLLYLLFDDVREEEWTPSYGARSSRVDFLIKSERIVVEVKKTRDGLEAGQIADQLILDISRYAKMSECEVLVCFVYDPENRISNPSGFEADLSFDYNDMVVRTLVVPRLH